MICRPEPSATILSTAQGLPTQDEHDYGNNDHSGNHYHHNHVPPDHGDNDYNDYGDNETDGAHIDLGLIPAFKLK